MFNIFKKKTWPPAKMNPPWEDGLSIYQHIAAHIDASMLTGLTDEGFRLPDEPARDPNAVSFIPGALDGMLGHHGFSKLPDQIGSDIFSALKSVTEDASEGNLRKLYSMVRDGSAVGVIDEIIEKIQLDRSLDANRLYEIVHWFTTEAADREVVKFSMALLGLFRGRDDSEIFLTLGRHDEFTLYAAVALSNNENYSDKVLWRLAKAVQGWGRIHSVERLVSTTDTKIKDWLVREGYVNQVMFEYLACICARAGELHIALLEDFIDDELFNSACEIMDTLLLGEGGPAEGLSDYEHGCAVIVALLAHGSDRFASVSHYSFLCRLQERLGAHQSGESRLMQDWSDDAVAGILASLTKLLAEDRWKTMIVSALETGNQQQFWDASRSCRHFGIDPWPYFYNRTKAGEEYWWDLMRESNHDRIDQVLELGMKCIPLDKIATGPGNELGLGSEYSAHRALDFILQGLDKYPGKGWSFIDAGLQSPVVRNRNMSINALSSWDRKEWPQEAIIALKQLNECEVDEDIRMRIKQLLAGNLN